MTEANREVFAWYGLAVAQAQVLETLVAGVVFLVSVSSQDADAQRDAWNGLSRKGLGGLLRLTPARDSSPADDVFDELRVLRNNLIHHWFRDPKRIERLETPEGRDALVDELTIVADGFGAASLLLSAVTLFILLAQVLSEKRG
jgi:hypothetical protein